MRTVVFETPGILDLRSITIMGLNVKPNSENPIGYFGTGLKYAMAVLARHDIPVSIITNGVRWDISPSTGTFRGQDFKPIDLVRHRRLLPPTVRTLPFTCSLGKNWKYSQAFRELESNTRDEGGQTHCFPDEESAMKEMRNDYTYIIVKSDDFAECVDNIDEIFLNSSLELVHKTDRIEVYKGESLHIFYRGIKVMELNRRKPSKYTYNIIRGMELTEDRTCKYSFEVAAEIGRMAKEAPFEQRDLIHEIVNAGDSYYEDTIEFSDNYWTSQPQEAFRKVVAESRFSPRMNRTAVANYIEYEEKHNPVHDPRPWTEKLAEAIQDDDFDSVKEIIQEARADVLLACQAIPKYTEFAEAFKTCMEHNPEIWVGFASSRLQQALEALAELADEETTTPKRAAGGSEGPKPRKSELLEDEIPF